jgi:hypothetical protein
MPVNAALSEFNDAGTRSNNGDPYLLSVKEASIVRQRLFVDAPYEADMLKHKARVLYDLASQHGEFPNLSLKAPLFLSR